MSGRTNRVQLVAAFAAIDLLWGGTYLAIALGLQSIPPFLLVGSLSISRWRGIVRVFSAAGTGCATVAGLVARSFSYIAGSGVQNGEGRGSMFASSGA